MAADPVSEEWVITKTEEDPDQDLTTIVFWKGPQWMNEDTMWGSNPTYAQQFASNAMALNTWFERFPELRAAQVFPNISLFRVAKKRWEIFRRLSEKAAIQEASTGAAIPVAAAVASQVDRLCERYGITDEIEIQDLRTREFSSRDPVDNYPKKREPASPAYLRETTPARTYSWLGYGWGAQHFKAERVQEIFQETFAGIEVQPKSPTP